MDHGQAFQGRRSRELELRGWRRLVAPITHRVSGKIIRVHTRDTEYKGHKRHASEDEPQYEIKSDKTDHIAMHKDSALTKIGH